MSSYFNQAKRKEALAGYLFIMPNLVGFFVFVLFGVVFSLAMSFTDWNLLQDFSSIKFVGLKNYLDLPKDTWFVDSFLNNLWFLLIIPIQIFLAMVTASVLNSKIYGKTALRAMFYLPYVTSMVAISVVWMTMFNPRFGPINHVLTMIGISNPPKWLASVQWAKPAIGIIIIWQQLGYHSLLYLSALQNIPRSLYEAAEVDGASSVQKFFRITLPLVSPTTFLIAVIAIIASFQSWSIIQILTQGGPGTSTHILGFYVYNVAFKFYRMGYASAISWVLFIIIFLITLIQWRGQKNWVNYSV